MARPLKDNRYKRIGGSLAQYHKGEYVGSIPHSVLYQFLKDKSAIGKHGVLGKSFFKKESATKVSLGKGTEFTGGGRG